MLPSGLLDNVLHPKLTHPGNNDAPKSRFLDLSMMAIRICFTKALPKLYQSRSSFRYNSGWRAGSRHTTRDT